MNRRQELAAWLEANGITPRDVLMGADMTIEDGPDGRVIRCEVCDLDADGRRQLDDTGTGVATKFVTTPLVKEPPEWWEPRVKPTREQLLEGEEPYTDEGAIPTPAQWIWLWNRATPAERLERARRIVEDWQAAKRCQEMNHEGHIRHLEATLEAQAVSHGPHLTGSEGQGSALRGELGEGG